MKYIVIDTETTGLDPDQHEMIEFGAIVMINEIITETLDIKIQPRSLDRAAPEAMKMNGYSEYRWRNALSQEFTIKMIWQFLERHRDGITVGHNLHFDRKFIEAFGRYNNLELKLSSPYLDTRDICRSVLAPYGLESMRLDDICEFLGWKRRKAHTALSDCEDCIRILRNMCPPKIKFIARLELQQKIRRIRGLL